MEGFDYERLENLIDRRTFDVLDVLKKLEKTMAATQADIDAITQALNALQVELTTDVQAIQSEIATLEAQGVDVTSLQAALGNLTGTVNTVNTIAPVVTPPPAGGSSSSSASASA